MRGHRSSMRGAVRCARSPIFVVVILTAVVALAAPASAAPLHPPIWVTTVHGDGNAYDAATALAVSAGGSLFSCGYIYRDATGDDVTIARWDDAPFGWSKTWDGPAHRADTAADIAIAPSGPVYVTGTTQNAAGNNDILLLRYSQTGSLQWVRAWRGPNASWEAGLKVAVDRQGHVLVAGTRRAGATTGRIQMVILKYASNGTLLWSHIVSRTDANLTLHDFCLDGSDNAYLVGDASIRRLDGVIACYSPTGVQRWVRYYDDPVHARDSFSAVCASPGGGVYVAGVSGASLGASDGLLVRYSAAGVSTLTKRLGSGDGKREWLNDVAVDGRGRVAVCGSWQVADPDTYVALLTSLGAVLWSHKYDGGYANADEAKVLTIDSLNRVCVASELRPDPDVHQWGVYAFSVGGTLRWHSQWPDPLTGVMSVRDIASYHASNVWVCGSDYVGPGTGGDQLLLGWGL
jgi:hypothetical protein